MSTPLEAKCKVYDYDRLQEQNAVLLRTVEELHKRNEERMAEIERLRDLLQMAYPFVEDMIGIASSARPVKATIDEYFEETEGSNDG